MMNKNPIIVVIGFLAGFFVSYFLFKLISGYILLEKQYEDAFPRDNIIIFSGDVISHFSGSKEISTGHNTGLILNDFDKFNKQKNMGNFRSYNPDPQPGTASSDYEERSNILNDYLTKNNFYFKLNENIKEGYLYIKLDKPTIDDIFLYRHSSNFSQGFPVSGKLRKDQSLISTIDGEYLFKLNEVPIIAYYNKKYFAYNWQTDLNKNQLQFIGGYIVGFDGNYIEEIIVSWE